MSITVVTTVVCDLCGQWTDATHGVTANRRAARHMARTEGWVRRRTKDVGYIDLCPECASSGSEGDESDLLWRPDIWPQPDAVDGKSDEYTEGPNATPNP